MAYFTPQLKIKNLKLKILSEFYILCFTFFFPDNR